MFDQEEDVENVRDWPNNAFCGFLVELLHLFQLTC